MNRKNNKKNTKIIYSQKKHTQRERDFEKIISLSNLILTILIGIVLTFYLKIRDEKFQQNLIESQINLEKQSELSNIIIENECPYTSYCDGVISIKNLGPANAKNLRIIITLINVNNNWKDKIYNIENVEVYVDPITINPTVTNYQSISNLDHNSANGYNSKMLTIENLPTNSYIDISIELDKDYYNLHSVSEERELFIINDSTYEFDGLQLIDLIDKYLESEYFSSTYTINVACDNCHGEVTQELTIISSLNMWQILEDSYNEEENIHSLSLRIFHDFPEENDYINKQLPLNLVLTEEYGNLRLYDIPPNYFMLQGIPYEK